MPFGVGGVVVVVFRPTSCCCVLFSPFQGCAANFYLLDTLCRVGDKKTDKRNHKTEMPQSLPFLSWLALPKGKKHKILRNHFIKDWSIIAHSERSFCSF